MKKTLATILLGLALLAPASAQVAGNPRSEPVDAKATDRSSTQSGTGLLPKDAKGQTGAGFSMPNRNFRAGSPVNSGAQDVKQFPAPPAAITPEQQVPIEQIPAAAPPAFDVKNAGDTTLDSSPGRDVKTQTAPPGVTTGAPAGGANFNGDSQNPSATQYSTKAAPVDSNSTLLPSLQGPRDNARSTRLTPSPREVKVSPVTGVRGGEPSR